MAELIAGHSWKSVQSLCGRLFVSRQSMLLTFTVLSILLLWERWALCLRYHYCRWKLFVRCVRETVYVQVNCIWYISKHSQGRIYTVVQFVCPNDVLIDNVVLIIEWKAGRCRQVTLFSVSSVLPYCRGWFTQLERRVFCDAYAAKVCEDKTFFCSVCLTAN